MASNETGVLRSPRVRLDATISWSRDGWQHRALNLSLGAGIKRDQVSTQDKHLQAILRSPRPWAQVGQRHEWTPWPLVFVRLAEAMRRAADDDARRLHLEHPMTEERPYVEGGEVVVDWRAINAAASPEARREEPVSDKNPLNLLRTPVGEMAEVEPLPSPWTWEERPAGEHEWYQATCLLCGLDDDYFVSEPPPCPSKMERRRVTPWEPVPTKEEADRG